MKDPSGIYEVLLRNNSFDKSVLIEKLTKTIEDLRKAGFDREEVDAYIEGSQAKMPQNIPLFKLWTKRIWETIEKKRKDRQR